MKKIYISGLITGRDYTEAYRHFEHVEIILRFMGFDPINPMKIQQKEGATWEDCMVEDIGHLIREADGIFMLEGWKKSKGARIEHAIILEMGLPVESEKSMNDFIKAQYH